MPARRQPALAENGIFPPPPPPPPPPPHSITPSSESENPPRVRDGSPYNRCEQAVKHVQKSRVEPVRQACFQPVMRVIPAGVVFGAGGWSVRILIRVRICRNVDMCLASCFVMPFKTKNSLVWPEYRYKTWTVGSDPVRYHVPISCGCNMEPTRFKQPPNRWQVASMKTPCFGSAWNRQDAAPPPQPIWHDVPGGKILSDKTVAVYGKMQRVESLPARWNTTRPYAESAYSE